ncbi:hypothetical protein FHT03_000269 [Xanthomonas arboricola]|nr:hypothetical protein [Xanthomonas cannabis]
MSRWEKETQRGCALLDASHSTDRTGPATTLMFD